MTRVTAIPFSLLSSDQLIDAFCCHALCEHLGKMVFFDAFMVNRDRLNNSVCNFGNFLLDLNDGYTLATNDHEFSIAFAKSEEMTTQFQFFLNGNFEALKSSLFNRLTTQLKDLKVTAPQLSRGYGEKRKNNRKYR